MELLGDLELRNLFVNGGLLDEFISEPIKIGSIGEQSFTTNKKDVVGAINELKNLIDNLVVGGIPNYIMEEMDLSNFYTTDNNIVNGYLGNKIWMQIVDDDGYPIIYA